MTLTRSRWQIVPALRNLYLVRHKSNQSSSTYCLESVKKYDYENFLCSLLLQGKPRSSALAVRGFNVEVGRVAESVSESNIGLMRLKFWEDAVHKCFLKDNNQIPHHPVIIELYKAIKSNKLTKRYLDNIITARIENISKISFPNLEALEKYSEMTVSSVYYLLLESHGIRNVKADHAVSHLGKAQGIVQHLRTIPLAKKLNFISIPQDILNKHKVSHEDILRGKESKELNECAFEVASRAHQHLVKAKNLSEDVPKEGRRVLLPAVAVDEYLTRLQKVNHNVMHPSLQRRSWLFLPKLYIKSMRNQL